MNVFDPAMPADLAEGQSLVATVLDARHPTMEGRFRLGWEGADGPTREGWAIGLRGVAPLPRYRVHAALPENGAELVITGILDRVATEDRPATDAGPSLSVAAGEALRITGPDGQPWLEIVEDPEGGGPRLRFLVPAEGVDLPGVLRLAADAVEIAARSGEIRMSAHGDVRVKGEIVRLN